MTTLEDTEFDVVGTRLTRQDRIHAMGAKGQGAVRGTPGKRAGLLASAGYRVSLTDRSQAALDRVEPHQNIRRVPLNVENSASLLTAGWLAGLDRTPRSFPDSPGWRPVYAAIGSRPGM